MKGTIEVENKEEAERLNAGLKNTRLRATTAIIGILSELSTADVDWIIRSVTELTGRDQSE